MNCSPRLWSRSRRSARRDHAASSTEPTLDAQVDRLLDELPDRFALAGLSLGGIVAMALVRRAPERVARLCLMSTNPHGPDRGATAGMGGASGDRLAAGATARELQRDLLPVLLSAGRDRPDLVEQTLAMADEVGAAALRRAAAPAGHPGRRAARPGRDVRCPTLVLGRAGRPVVPASTGTRRSPR